MSRESAMDGRDERGELAKNGPVIGEFYILRPDMRGEPHSLEFENASALRPPTARHIRPEQGGFPAMNEIPRLRQTEVGHLHNDLDADFEGYWLVSEQLKRVFESVDPEGFAFCRCEITFADGTVSDSSYLCDVVRVIDAIDDDASEVRILTDGYPKGKFYKLAGGARLAFHKNAIGSAHVFSSPFNSTLVICDRILRDALLQSGFGEELNPRGVRLFDAADY